MNDREQRIRERAHQIWEKEGQPEGRERDHWERAEREIDGEREQRAEHESPSSGRSSASSGVPSGIQPGGTKPGGGPAAGPATIGTGGESTANSATGSVKDRSRS